MGVSGTLHPQRQLTPLDSEIRLIRPEVPPRRRRRIWLGPELGRRVAVNFGVVVACRHARAISLRALLGRFVVDTLHEGFWFYA